MEHTFIDSGGNCWGIVTAIAFAEYEEFTLLIFGMPHEKCLQKIVHIFGYFIFIVIIINQLGSI